MLQGARIFAYQKRENLLYAWFHKPWLSLWCYKALSCIVLPKLSVEVLKRCYAEGDRCFINANIMCADLSNLNLSQINLGWASLREANLSGASLPNADLTEADLSDANLSGTDLTGANMKAANFQLDTAK